MPGARAKHKKKATLCKKVAAQISCRTGLSASPLFLAPEKVRAATEFYEAIFKEFPDNVAAQARAQLMDKIIQLAGN